MFTKLAKLHCSENGNRRFDFGDLDLIFKATLALCSVQNIVYCALSSKPVDG